MGQNLIKQIEDAHQNNETSIDLSRKNLTILPSQIFNFGSSVERLALSGNYLSELPPEFQNLKRLRYLNIRGNYFKQFPAVLYEMTGLEILDISKNKLETLPEDVARLEGLKILSIESNRINKLPFSLCQMKELKVLKFKGNQLDVDQFPQTTVKYLDDITDPQEYTVAVKDFLRQQIEDAKLKLQQSTSIYDMKYHGNGANEEGNFDGIELRERLEHVMNLKKVSKTSFDVTREAIFTIGFSLIQLQKFFQNFRSNEESNEMFIQVTMQARQIIHFIEFYQNSTHTADIWNSFISCIILSKRFLYYIRSESQNIFQSVDFRIAKEQILTLYLICVNLRESCELFISHIQHSAALIRHQQSGNARSQYLLTIIKTTEQSVEAASFALNIMDKSCKTHATLKGKAKHDFQEVMASIWTVIDQLKRSISHSKHKLAVEPAAFQQIIHDINSFLSKSAKLAQNFKILLGSHKFNSNAMSAMQVYTKSVKALALAIKAPQTTAS